MNNFIKAVEDNDVLTYLIGKGKYFVRDFEIADVHNPSMKWDEINESFLLNRANIDEFWKGMMELLNYSDINLGLWYFNIHLENYIRYHVNDQNNNSVLSEYINAFVSKIKEKRESLEKEKRRELFILYDYSNMYKAIMFNMHTMGIAIE